MVRFGSSGKPEYDENDAQWYRAHPEVVRWDYARLPAAAAVTRSSTPCGPDTFKGRDPFPGADKTCQCGAPSEVGGAAQAADLA